MEKFYLALVIVLCMSPFVAAPAEEGRVSLQEVSSAELEYLILREVAKNGDPVVQLDAFLQVSQNLPELQPHLVEALDLLETSADSGFRNAQYMRGYILVRGQIVDEDIDVGLKWLEKADKSGHERASLWIGVTHAGSFYKESSSRKKANNFHLAERWLEKTIADQNGPTEISIEAMTVLGRLCAARDIDDPKGIELLFQATDLGSSRALETLEALQQVLAENIEDQPKPISPVLERVTSYLESRKPNPAQP